MNIVLILAGGRAGSDLLQSLFDSHPQILQFPGILKFDEKFLKIFNLKSTNEISKYFIRINKHFFDSRFNKIERHNQLGKKKNSFYKVDKKNFIRKFSKFYNKSNKTNLDLLLALHKAYSNNLKKKKLLVIHIHLFELLKNYIKIIGFGNNLKILLTLRDPLAGMSSSINHWLDYKKGIYLSSRNLFNNYNIIFNSFNNYAFLRKRIRVIKLEKLHKFSIKTTKKISKYLKINFNKTMLTSTYHGKLWWGDSISKKYLKGLNKNFKNKFDHKLFDKKEVLYLESKIFYVIKKYNYPFRSSVTNYSKNFYLLPFNIEKKIFLNAFKKSKFKSLLSFVYFYIKRILLLGKKNIFNLSNLPHEI